MSKRKQIEELIEHFQNQEGTEYVAKHLTAALSFVPEEVESENVCVNDESPPLSGDTTATEDIDVQYDHVQKTD